MKYHKSKYSHKITLNRKTAAKFKKLVMHGAPHKIFGTVGQNFNSLQKVFDTVGQNFDFSPQKFRHRETKLCYPPKIFQNFLYSEKQ